MPSYGASIQIAASPEAVFELVADLEGHGDWSADPLEITATGDGTFRSSTRAKGKQIEAVLHVVESVASQRFVFDATDATGRWRHTFTLEPVDGGTRVRREIAGELSGGQLLLYWLVLLPIKKPAAAKALERLKARVEGNEGGA